MRSYECAVIFRPTLGDDTLRARTTKYIDVIAGTGGEITRLETWGKRRLAYEIDDFTEGHYFLYRFRGVGGVLDELGRQMRIDEEVIRHLIVIDELASGDEPALDPKNVEVSVRQEKEREKEREEA